MKRVWYVLLLFSCLLSAVFASKEIVVDLSEQMAYAYEDGDIVFAGRISSGKIGRETPNGEFRILEKKRYHRSNMWPKPNGGAKMNYMLRLTNSGIAMHLGYVPKRPVSHGCIRLKNGFAQRIYRWAKVGTPVYVEGSAKEYLYYHQPASTKGGWHYDDEYAIIDFHD